MTTNTENHEAKTIILKPAAGGGSVVIDTIRGLPYGVPIMGKRISTKYGEATCTGIQKSGSEPNATADLVTLTLNLT